MTATKPFDLLVFVGRFQPLHIGHQAVIDSALERAGTVLLLVGSSNRARSLRNPFSFPEREEMIGKVYPYEVNTERLVLRELPDVLYNDEAWTSNVQRIADGVTADLERELGRPPRVGLIGHERDGTSYYLKLFPQWKSVDVKHEVGVFNATDIRRAYFQGAPQIARDILPEPVAAWLAEFMHTDAFRDLVAEARWLADYKQAWSTAPFTPTFVTVDNVVVQSGHILLVRRGGHPGKGQLALPGGFVDTDATLLDNAIRELREETQLADQHGKYPMGKLKGFLAGQGVFDDPNRSVRGYTLTHAFLFRLPPAKALLRVEGADDAVSAEWHPIGTLEPTEFFEDHYFIINKMLDGVA